MTALNRVNALLKSRAAILALTAILLGMIAVSAAQAVSVNNLCGQTPTPPTGSTCSFTATPSVISAPIGSIATPTDSLIAAPTAVGGVTVSGSFGFTADVAGEYDLQLLVTGPTAGIPLGAPGVAGIYDVIIDAGVGGTVNGTVLDFGVTPAGASTDWTAVVLGAGHGYAAGVILPLDPTVTITQWSMMFTVDWIAPQGSVLAVDFPLTENPVPEPVSVLLVGSGIGLLTLLRRWRKA